MSAIEIDMDDYLSEDEKREIARDEFRRGLARTLATPNDVERFVGNIAYTVVWGEIDKQATEDMRVKIAEKVVEVIDKMNIHTIVDRGNSTLRSKPTAAAKMIDEFVDGHRGEIEAKVHDLIGQISLSDVESEFHSVISDMFGRVTNE